MTATLRTKRAIIYTRISQDKTGEGEGVQRQEELCRHLAASRGWQVIAVYEDNSISATTGKERPKFDAALRAIEAGEADVIIAYAIDRLTRSIRDLLRLIDAGAEVITANGEVDLTTTMGRMIATIIAAVAAAEVEQKAARQVLANQQKARKGGRTKGVRPFGFEDDGVTVREVEAAAIRKAASDVLEGASLGSVAREWRERGFRPSQKRNGRETDWSVGGVKYVLRSPRYIGKRAYRSKAKPGQEAVELVTDAVWDAILDVDTFERLRFKLDDPARLVAPGYKRTGMVPENLLASVATCGKCGGRVRATTRSTGVKVYGCRDHGCFSVAREGADMLVAAEVIAWAGGPDMPSLLPAEGGDAERAALVVELAELEQAKADLGAALGQRKIGLAVAMAAEAQYDQDIARIGAQLSHLEQGSVLEGLSTAESATAWWEGLTLGRKRSVVQGLMIVELLPQPRGRTGFHDDLVRLTPVA